MKESDRIFEKCKKLQEELFECYQQEGFKARYLGWCNKQNLKLNKCKMEHFEQKRREHNEETFKLRRKRLDNQSNQSN